MKRLSIILLFTTILLCLSSCGKEPAANYYIKYEAYVSSIIYEGREARYVVSTDNGDITITTRRQSWSETYGPVEKGFTANITGSTNVDYSNGTTMTLNIYVCRGEEPFVFKASATDKIFKGKQSLSASYKIDF